MKLKKILQASAAAFLAAACSFSEARGEYSVQARQNNLEKYVSLREYSPNRDKPKIRTLEYIPRRDKIEIIKLFYNCHIPINPIVWSPGAYGLGIDEILKFPQEIQPQRGPL